MSVRTLNYLCRLLYRGEYKRFMKPCSVEWVQNEYLLDLLRKNAGTVYGEKYGFSEIKSYEDFAEKVPLTVYEDYEPYINEISEGRKNVLTAEDVTLLEPTSGSSGGKKLVPYTKALQREFQRGIRPWLYDIYKNVEGVCDGMSYWSITPVTDGKSYTKSGIPIGFEEDTAYFGRLEQAVMKKLFAVDGSVKFSGSMEDFYFQTASQLLACKSLTLISVWNPTFLTILCDFIRDNINELVSLLTGDRREQVMDGAKENRFDIIFPDLKIISCWADGSAADDIGEIKKRFPEVYIQPKGLLATEGFFSFPLTGETGSRLSIYSHFFEFRRLSDGEIITAEKLTPGEYEIIVTTGGGFYRYQIGDIVEVIEVYPDSPPRIKFLRRSGISSDLCGEKLTEEFVRNVCKKLGITDHFCLLAPDGKGYCFYTTAEGITDEILDGALRESYHYNYCRQLGQLRRAEVCKVKGDPAKKYLERLTSEGMRLGDIKPAYLSRKTDWGKYFERK
ncbi:MAG: GH3 auxin-responsive promoter family protein [Oscillospiraceae bacterium]|nr:GH3 auxin-responsive promoter family protein [Oscillospiraceae bacterium]